MVSPHFFREPIRYMRWASHEKPAIFFSVVIGSLGPIMLLAAPPIKRAYGIKPRAQIPMTYPIPGGPRQTLSGYDD